MQERLHRLAPAVRNPVEDGKGNMGRRILFVVLLLIAILVYVGYNTYDAKRAGASGDVFSSDSPMERQGRTKADTGSGGNASPQPAVVYPSPAVQTVPVTPDNAPQTSAQISAPTSTPAGSGGDTISPNPPNGMVFSGTGHYQLYRQGNLTWRLNTDTGQSCILFATDEEWKKPKVYRAGCGSR
jgi:hypothetical protein